MPTPLDAALAHVDANIDAEPRAAEGAHPHQVDLDRSGLCRRVQRAADWLVADLKSEGFEASARKTPGHPMVVGHGPKAAAGRMSCSTATTTCSRSIR